MASTHEFTSIEAELTCDHAIAVHVLFDFVDAVVERLGTVVLCVILQSA